MIAEHVNPTRMELTRLKRRLITARRGHKLLKDKRDEMMKQFLDVVRENRALRERVEASLSEVYGSFLVASAVMSGQVLEQSLMFPKRRVEVDIKTKNIMSVNVPVFETRGTDTDLYAYGFYGTSRELDAAVDRINGLLPALLSLAEKEKSAQLLAAEIEKTRRRVNALEYVMIPRFEEKIRFIKMKLDENERSATTRLMKVKDLMLKQRMQQPSN
ncbi:MAG: V-type ATP synthase subunit D [Clostridiales bacterium]|jgi:V/A-type H+-transporting ATPase subunit D|nr:V-type ATP synthase subunit D [Clostridiales bacterium]